jgi:hypothetical protein
VHGQQGREEGRGRERKAGDLSEQSEVSDVLEQDEAGLELFLATGFHQWRVSSLCRHRDSREGRKGKIGEGQRRVAHFALSIEIGSVAEEKSHDLRVALATGEMERGSLALPPQ